MEFLLPGVCAPEVADLREKDEQEQEHNDRVKEIVNRLRSTERSDAAAYGVKHDGRDEAENENGDE